jgi:hypothetical protein
MADLYEKYLSRLAGRFVGKPNIEAFLRTAIKPYQELSDACDFILTMANLDDAVGYWLDIHGSRVAEKRDGRDDDEYRDAIKFKIALKSPKATISAIFKALNFFAPKIRYGVYIPHYPAGFSLLTDSPLIRRVALEGIKKITAAGVGLDVYYTKGMPISFLGGLSDQTFLGQQNNRLVYAKHNNNLVKIKLQTLYYSKGGAHLGGLIGSYLGTQSGNFIKTQSGKRIMLRSNMKSVGGFRLSGVYTV